MPEALGWSRKSDPERLEAMTRWSAYFVLALGPFMAWTVVADASDWRGAGGPVYLALTVLQAFVAAGAMSACLDASLGRREVPHAWLVVLGGTTALVVGTALAWFPGLPEEDSTQLAFAVHVVLAVALAAASPLLSWRQVGVVALVVGLVWGGVAGLLGAGERTAVLSGAVSAGVLFLLGLSVRSSVWMIRVFWEQERRRQVDARLAVAEERLSFSRDLHDTFGRTLATVAVKSELAAELASRGRPGAAAEMLEVRQIAEDALREMRELVAGFRAPDLGSELAGARSLLGSAGVSVSVTADDGELPAAPQEALAWVVREAVTNVVRHSDAARCTIVLRVEASGEARGGADGASSSASAVLEVHNDGARRSGGSPGAGLRGLGERLAAVGGSLDAAHDGEEFHLVARVPLASEEAAR